MNGWDEFEGYIQRARARMEDRWAPVALVCLQVREPSETAEVDVLPDHDAAVIWPVTFPIPERGPLLARIARPYRDGTVLR